MTLLNRLDVSLVPAVCAPMTKRLMRYFLLSCSVTYTKYDIRVYNFRMGAAQALLSIVQFG